MKAVSTRFRVSILFLLLVLQEGFVESVAHANGFCEASMGSLSEESAAELVEEVFVELTEREQPWKKIFKGSALKVPKFYQEMKGDYELAKVEGERIRESVKNLDNQVRLMNVNGGMSFRERLFALGRLYDQTAVKEERKVVLKHMMAGFDVQHEVDYFALLQDKTFSAEVRWAIYTALVSIFNNGRYSASAWTAPADKAMRAGGLK